MLCLDGNFGLVRKKSSGRDVNPPRMGDLYFFPQAAVDAFVEKFDDGKKVQVFFFLISWICHQIHTLLSMIILYKD